MATGPSSTADQGDLQRRLAQLEQQVAALEQRVVQMTQAAQPNAARQPDPSPAPAAAPGHINAAPHPQRSRSPHFKIGIPEHMRSGEYWLNKLGIGLLLFGVVFLFKYSVDRGWLTPPIRVALGVVLGVGLIALGVRLWVQRRHFAKVLAGGGIATLYITDFAAFQLFSLVSHSMAFGLMVAVTAIAFILSLRQDDAILSLIGALGGLGTPFILYTGSGDVPGLMIYMALLLACTGGVYLFKGWRSLLLVSVIGGWIVCAVPLADEISAGVDRWAFQGGVVWAWLMFWGVPLVREVLYNRDPARWPRPPVERLARIFSTDEKTIAERQTHMLSVSTPLIALILTMAAWNLSPLHTGLVWIAAAVVYGAAAWGVAREQGPVRLAYAQGIVGLMLLTVGVYFTLEGDTLFVTIATEAAALILIGRRVHDRIITGAGHILFAIVGVWLLDRVGGPGGETSAIAADLWAIVVGLGLSTLMSSAKLRRLYFLVAYGCLTLFFFRELDSNLWLPTITVQMVLLHVLARADQPLEPAGHIYFGFAAMTFIGRLKPYALLTANYPESFTRIWNLDHLTALIFLATAVAVTMLFRNRATRRTYLIAAHIGMLLWLYRLLVAFDSGQVYVSIAWGLYSIALLVTGLRLDQRNLRVAAMVSIFMVVAKLFLVDLAQIQAIWRVLLFMGFGGALLALSYYFRALWAGRIEKGPPKDVVN